MSTGVIIMELKNILINSYDILLGVLYILSDAIKCILFIREGKYYKLLDEILSCLPSTFNATDSAHIDSIGYKKF